MRMRENCLFFFCLKEIYKVKAIRRDLLVWYRELTADTANGRRGTRGKNTFLSIYYSIYVCLFGKWNKKRQNKNINNNNNITTATTAWEKKGKAIANKRLL